MSPSAALVEAGVRAYMRGDREEAERCWRMALDSSPPDERAREYLASLSRTPLAAPAPARPAPAGGARPESAWDELPSSGAPITLPPDGGLDLHALRPEGMEPPVAPPAPAAPHVADAEDVHAWMDAARAEFALGNFSGSLEHIERILAVDPRHPDALAYLKENEETLVGMYESKLAPLSRRPRVRVRSEEVPWLNLDHRAGFLLAQIDGTVTWEDLFALSNLPRLDTARILARLVDDGVVAA